MGNQRVFSRCFGFYAASRGTGQGRAAFFCCAGVGDWTILPRSGSRLFIDFTAGGDDYLPFPGRVAQLVRAPP